RDVSDAKAVHIAVLDRIGRLGALKLLRSTLTERRHRNLSSYQIVNGEWQIQDHKECEREHVHFEKIKRVVVRENVEQRFRLRFVKQKSVIDLADHVRG